MLRDPEEIRQSWEAMFDKRAPAMFHPGAEPDYWQVAYDLYRIMENRRDTQITLVQYRRILSAPLKIFQRLRTAGWPIDPDKAASVIQGGQCRFRREELEEGV